MRHKEIQHLKGEEVVESDDDEEIPEVVPEKKSAKKEKATKKEEVEKPVKGKKSKEARGDADSSSDEDESDDEPKAQTTTERRAADAKLKKDLAAEQKEMAKVLMTNRQRKLYQKVQGEIDQKKEVNQKLKIKRKLIEKKNKK